MKVYVSYEDYCEFEESAQEQYGDWSQSFSFCLGQASLSKPGLGQFEEIETGVSLTVGQKVHVLLLRYGEGDSFGHASGKGEVMWVFSDENLAKEAKKRFEFACGEHPQGVKLPSIAFKTDCGKYVALENPVGDYFAVLESLELRELLLKP